jgi:hypothetical protein
VAAVREEVRGALLQNPHSQVVRPY